MKWRGGQPQREWQLHPLRRAVLVVASVGLVLATGALGFYFNSRATTKAEQTHRDDRETLQTTLAGLGSQYQLFALKEEADFAGAGPWGLRPGDPGDRARLEAFASRSALLGYGAALRDLGHDVLNAFTSGPGLPASSDPGYEPMFRGLLSAQPGVSSVMHVGQIPLVALAVPVVVAGAPQAVFVGYFRADRSALQTYVEQLRFGHTGRHYVVDSEGGIIAANDPAVVGTRLSGPPVLAAVAQGRSGLIGYGHGSASRIVSFAPFRLGGWGSLTVQDAGEFYGPIRSGQLHIELALVALLGIAAAAIAILSYKREAARRRFQEQLAHQASHDGLTGLPNRSMFNDRLGAALSRHRRHGGDLAVLYLDLDGFKEVNDQLGHDVGDALLIEVAGRLRTSVRSEDMVARMGGDEFTVVMEDIPELGVTVGVVGRILEAMAEPVLVAGRHLSVSTSVGIAHSHNGDAAVEDILRDADLAMYRAKDGGGSKCVIFDDLLSPRQNPSYSL
jgi:diguanylate cyclase (GGDEF)-like protein